MSMVLKTKEYVQQKVKYPDTHTQVSGMQRCFNHIRTKEKHCVVGLTTVFIYNNLYPRKTSTAIYSFTLIVKQKDTSPQRERGEE